MIAMLAAPDSMIDGGWFPDSRAMNHNMNDPSNLTFGNEYLGGNKIMMGNGASLVISHTGSSKFRCPRSSKILI